MVDKASLAVEEDMAQVLGGLLLNPELLYDSNYPLAVGDFVRDYGLVFGAISNLIRQGMRDFDDMIIAEYILKYFAKWSDIYSELHPEQDFVEELKKNCKLYNFDYHYNNVKKMTFLRDLNDEGFDITRFYDVSKVDETLNAQFEKKSLDEIISEFNLIANSINGKWVNETTEQECFSSETVTDEELDEAIEGEVEVGHKFPLGLEVLTHIYRGQLPQKYHLNMAGSGVGKTRIKMLEAVNNACEFMWDTINNKWLYIGEAKPTLFISTEVTKKSLLTMMLAIVSGVEESKIKRKKYSKEELKRVKKAKRIFKQGKLFFEYSPVFTIESIEACVEKNVLNNKLEHLYFDYMHVTSSVMASIAKKTGNKGLGTDKILEAFSVELKNATNKYFINFATSCQVNRNSQGEDGKNFGSARGAYSLPDKFDNVMFSTTPTKAELKKFTDLELPNLSGEFSPFGKPNFCITILKNRDGEDNEITLWFNLNRGNMRFHYINATDKDITTGYDLKIDKYAYEKEESDNIEMLEFLEAS